MHSVEVLNEDSDSLSIWTHNGTFLHSLAKTELCFMIFVRLLCRKMFLHFRIFIRALVCKSKQSIILEMYVFIVMSKPACK